MKTIIIDDEEMARTLLKGMLEEYCPEVEVIDLCKDVATGVKSIHKHQPDLVFLDIEMPGINGLQLLDFFNHDEISFSIIFVTAYNQYAIQALKLSAVDYLLKPVESDDLVKAIELYSKKNDRLNYSVLKNNLNNLHPLKIAVHNQNSIKYICLDDIAFFKGDGAYTHIILSDNSEIMVSKGLKHFEEVLNNHPNYMRTHKSYLVNIQFVSEYVKTDGGYLLVNGHQVSITGDKVSEITERMQNLKK